VRVKEGVKGEIVMSEDAVRDRRKGVGG
jgi:hypothetical protein